MAKRRAKTTEQTDAQLQTQMTEAHHAEVEKHVEPAAEQDKTVGHVANPSATPRPHNFAQREEYKRPGRGRISVGNGIEVSFIEHGNKNGVGVQIDFPEGRKPTPEELAIIHEHLPADQGYRWEKPPHLAHRPDVPKEWHKAIGEDAFDKKAVAIRLATESRAAALAEALKAHQADPVGYAEMVKQQREQAAESQRIPD